jgi:DeoR/GlpR family transcriptional regulator of sugar metabolism
MLKLKRTKEIMQLLNERGTVTVRELTELFNVTDVTIRRDLQELEAQNLLMRTHGGAVRAASRDQSSENGGNAPPPADALIIGPVQNRVAHTLRERAIREQMPLLAESAPFDGAIYLGPDNYHGAYQLGQWTGEYLRQRGVADPFVLDMTSELPNGDWRSSGFVDGLRSVIEHAHIFTVDGQNVYGAAYGVAVGALSAHREINVLFGVNDDLILAALQAVVDLGLDPEDFVAVNVGGEGKTLFDALDRRGALKACLALFPEVVGRKGVEAVLRLWNGETGIEEVITPCAVITADTLHHYYTHVDDDWQINLPAMDRLEQTVWTTPTPRLPDKRLSFVIHFRTHEWYQNLAHSMQQRGAETGVAVTVEDVNEDLKAEIIELRRMIGKKAATYVQDGDTIFLDTGSTTSNLAQFLDGYRNLTVITNSIAIFHQLQRNSNINLILTGGEFHHESQSFIGRGVQLFLQELRVDKAFLVASGVTTSFGVSCRNQEEADVRRSVINASREVVLLVDHTVIGTDSNVFVTQLNRINTIITDAGIQAGDRLGFNRFGIRVMVVGEVGP